MGVLATPTRARLAQLLQSALLDWSPADIVSPRNVGAQHCAARIRTIHGPTGLAETPSAPRRAVSGETLQYYVLRLGSKRVGGLVVSDGDCPCRVWRETVFRTTRSFNRLGHCHMAAQVLCHRLGGIEFMSRCESFRVSTHEPCSICAPPELPRKPAYSPGIVSL